MKREKGIIVHGFSDRECEALIMNQKEITPKLFLCATCDYAVSSKAHKCYVTHHDESTNFSSVSGVIKTAELD